MTTITDLKTCRELDPRRRRGPWWRDPVVIVYIAVVVSAIALVPFLSASK